MVGMAMTFTPVDEHLFHVQATIDRHGFHITSVLGDRHHPTYTYTTGFLRWGQPEAVTLGLAPESSAGLLHHLFDRIRAGGRWGVGPGHRHQYGRLPFLLREVPARHSTRPGCLLAGIPSYFGPAVEILDGPAAVQVVWPDPTGRFPWDPLVEPTVWRDQPVLADGDRPERRRPLAAY
jgi:Domain of unknown function (DUF4262)